MFLDECMVRETKINNIALDVASVMAHFGCT